MKFGTNNKLIKLSVKLCISLTAYSILNKTLSESSNGWSNFLQYLKSNLRFSISLITQVFIHCYKKMLLSISDD